MDLSARGAAPHLPNHTAQLGEGSCPSRFEVSHEAVPDVQVPPLVQPFKARDSSCVGLPLLSLHDHAFPPGSHGVREGPGSPVLGGGAVLLCLVLQDLATAATNPHESHPRCHVLGLALEGRGRVQGLCTAASGDRRQEAGQRFYTSQDYAVKRETERERERLREWTLCPWAGETSV